MISILIGKPGSGKSYHATKEILKLLENDIRRNASRKVYTNIALNIEEVNIYLSTELGEEVDVSSRVVLLDDSFFVFDRSLVRESDFKTFNQGIRRTQVVRDDSLGYWWNRFENDAVIIIDEIQRFVGGTSKDDRSVVSSIAVYFSTHRHRRHDIILISQALTNIPLEMRKYAEVVYELFNAKSLSLPFPISVSGRDLEILFKGLGLNRQVYRVRRGLLDIGRPHIVDFQGEAEVVTTSPNIYRCYNSHTLAKDKSAVFISDSDLPFKLGPGQKWRAIKWFLGKYWFNWVIKIAIAIFIFLSIKSFFKAVFTMGQEGSIFQLTNFATPTQPNKDTENKKPTTKQAPTKTTQDSPSDMPKTNVDDVEEGEMAARVPSIVYTSTFVVIDGRKFEREDVLPSGVVLRGIDVRRRRLETVDLESWFFSNMCFVDYMLRLSRSSSCEACGR